MEAKCRLRGWNHNGRGRTTEEGVRSREMLHKRWLSRARE